MLLTHAQRTANLRVFYDTWKLDVDEQACREEHARVLKGADPLPADLHGRELWARYAADLFPDRLDGHYWQDLVCYDSKFRFYVRRVPERLASKGPGGHYNEHERGIVSFIHHFARVVYGSSRARITNKSFLPLTRFAIKEEGEKEFVLEVDGRDSTLELYVFNR